MREDRQTQSQIRINSVGNMNRNTSKAVMYGKSITTDSSEHRLEAGFHDRQNKMKAQERTSVIFCPIARLDSLPHSFADSEENRLHSSFFRRRRLFNFISRQTFCPFLWSFTLVILLLHTSLFSIQRLTSAWILVFLLFFLLTDITRNTSVFIPFLNFLPSSSWFHQRRSFRGSFFSFSKKKLLVWFLLLLSK